MPPIGGGVGVGFGVGVGVAVGFGVGVAVGFGVGVGVAVGTGVAVGFGVAVGTAVGFGVGVGTGVGVAGFGVGVGVCVGVGVGVAVPKNVGASSLSIITQRKSKVLLVAVSGVVVLNIAPDSAVFGLSILMRKRSCSSLALSRATRTVTHWKQLSVAEVPVLITEH